MQHFAVHTVGCAEDQHSQSHNVILDQVWTVPAEQSHFYLKIVRRYAYLTYLVTFLKSYMLGQTLGNR